MTAREMIEVDGHEIGLSHTDKVLFPEAGLTKGDLIDYYHRIAPVMLPHIAGRPLSFQRYPDGITADGFMQKNAAGYFPDWVERARLAKQDGEVKPRGRGRCGDARLPREPGGSDAPRRARARRSPGPARPPGDRSRSVGRRLRQGRSRAARAARQLVEAVGLVPFVQTTGSRGLHVWVPLERGPDFEEVRGFAGALAARLVAQSPDELTVEQRKVNRGTRVYVDVARNAYAQTAAAPYTVRARPLASVATPLAWPEIDDGTLAADRYTIANLFRRLGQKPDPWHDIERHARPLAAAQQRLAALT